LVLLAQSPHISHRRSIYFIILGVSADEPDIDALEVIFDSNDQPILIPLDIENHPVAWKEVGAAVAIPHVCGAPPRCLIDLLKPGAQRLFRILMTPPKRLEC
jgi:hypothetical protein